METLFDVIRAASHQVDQYDPHRTPLSINTSTMSELGELSDEILIDAGLSYKLAGKDGIFGEAIDAIACLLDLIYKHNPNVTEQELVDYAKIKMVKWVNKERENYQKSIASPGTSVPTSGPSS